MSELEPPPIQLHEDSDLFRESVNFTAAQTAFAARLIEKDYFSTVLAIFTTVSNARSMSKSWPFSQ